MTEEKFEIFYFFRLFVLSKKMPTSSFGNSFTTSKCFLSPLKCSLLYKFKLKNSKGAFHFVQLCEHLLTIRD